MNKKKLFVALLFVAILAQAKDHKIVVKGPGNQTKSKTEVTSHEGEGSDTITVTPGSDISKYTDVINHSNNLTDKQKEYIGYGLATALYSAKYWESEFNE